MRRGDILLGNVLADTSYATGRLTTAACSTTGRSQSMSDRPSQRMTATHTNFFIWVATSLVDLDRSFRDRDH